MRTIKTNSLEIFKQNTYVDTDLGLVSNNAYLSIVVTNKCQMKCSYCINSETDQKLQLPIDKAILNIRNLVSMYGIQEAILLGGEPLLHPEILKLVKKLRLNSGLEFIRLTTNGIKLKNNPDFIKKLVDAEIGIQGLNISFHNEDFMSYTELKQVYDWVKEFNPNIKIRINTNIWKGNLDDIDELLTKVRLLNDSMDEIRISNIIPKDNFSVNPKNKAGELILSNEEYDNIFTRLIEHYESRYSIFENKDTLGFVRYVLIPTKKPIIINWNIGSKVSDQVCENNIKSRLINTFKCLVTGEISLSWNETNIIDLFYLVWLCLN